MGKPYKPGDDLPCFKFILGHIKDTNKSTPLQFAAYYMSYLQACGVIEPKDIHRKICTINLSTKLHFVERSGPLNLFEIKDTEYVISNKPELVEYKTALSRVIKETRSFAEMYKKLDRRMGICYLCPLSPLYSLTYIDEEYRIMKYALSGRNQFREVFTKRDDIELILHSYNTAFDILKGIEKPFAFPGCKIIAEIVYEQYDSVFSLIGFQKNLVQQKLKSELNQYGINSGTKNIPLPPNSPVSFDSIIFDYLFEMISNSASLTKDEAALLREKLIENQKTSCAIDIDVDGLPYFNDEIPSPVKRRKKDSPATLPSDNTENNNGFISGLTSSFDNIVKDPQEFSDKGEGDLLAVPPITEDEQPLSETSGNDIKKAVSKPDDDVLESADFRELDNNFDDNDDDNAVYENKDETVGVTISVSNIDIVSSDGEIIREHTVADAGESFSLDEESDLDFDNIDEDDDYVAPDVELARGANGENKSDANKNPSDETDTGDAASPVENHNNGYSEGGMNVDGREGINSEPSVGTDVHDVQNNENIEASSPILELNGEDLNIQNTDDTSLSLKNNNTDNDTNSGAASDETVLIDAENKPQNDPDIEDKNFEAGTDSQQCVSNNAHSVPDFGCKNEGRVGNDEEKNTGDKGKKAKANDLLSPLSIPQSETEKYKLVDNENVVDRIISHSLLNGFCLIEPAIIGDNPSESVVIFSNNEFYFCPISSEYLKKIVYEHRYFIGSMRLILLLSCMKKNEISVTRPDLFIPLDHIYQRVSGFTALPFLEQIHKCAEHMDSRFAPIEYKHHQKAAKKNRDLHKNIRKYKEEYILDEKESERIFLYNAYANSLYRSDYMSGFSGQSFDKCVAYDDNNQLGIVPFTRIKAYPKSDGILFICRYTYKENVQRNELIELGNRVISRIAKGNIFSNYPVYLVNHNASGFMIFAEKGIQDYMKARLMLHLFQESSSMNLKDFSASMNCRVFNKTAASSSPSSVEKG